LGAIAADIVWMFNLENVVADIEVKLEGLSMSNERK
jgi:hypothetical protein